MELRKITSADAEEAAKMLEISKRKVNTTLWGIRVTLSAPRIFNFWRQFAPSRIVFLYIY